MRKFFTFRSSAASHGDSSSNGEARKPEYVEEKPRIPEYEDLDQWRSQSQEWEGSSSPRFRRSFSTSYPASYCGYEGSTDSANNHGISPGSRGSSPFHGAECLKHCNSFSPERYTRSRRHDCASNGQIHALEKLEPFGSSNVHQSSDSGIHGGLSEHRSFYRKPPRAQSTAPSSPTLSSARERFNLTKSELETRTRRLEKEKNELQVSLEKELDRRSAAWSLKLEKFQAEEHRLRERVRELAEQNVSLQREVSALKGSEADNRNNFMDLQVEVNDLTTSLGNAKRENDHLHQALSELQVRYNGIEEDLGCVRTSSNEKDKEIKDLQELVVRLQRTCTEQDKTISGLRLQFSDENGKQSAGRNDGICQLQVEQLRLAGVEQKLRKEVESSKCELESLRRENAFLLERLKGYNNGSNFSPFRVDHELCSQLDCLKTQGLSLLNDNACFCGELITCIKNTSCKISQEASIAFRGYTDLEYSSKYQSLKRRIDNFSRALHTMTQISEMKSDLGARECQPLATETNASIQPRIKDGLERELKAEVILTRILREKLLSKELELEQLQEDFASSVRIHDAHQTEMQKLLDEISHLRLKTRNIELEIKNRDEANKKLRLELQECIKELALSQSTLRKISEERDQIWVEVQRSRETVMLLEHEVSSLRKKIETLDEEVLIKEGQITILKDSLGTRQLDLIYSPKSAKEFPSKEFHHSTCFLE